VDLGTAQQARTTAERDLAAASASRDGLAERLTELQGREQAALSDVSDLRARADQSAEVAREAASNVARMQEALTRESGEAQRLRAETLELRNQLNACSVENARLNGLLGRDTWPAVPATARPKK
jgi:predicted nuclease with TOPRIM domain